ncbi:Hypothetical predicted protein [Cloeon dipterum]|uniref:Multiple inositol polyphosphate phosphatase 1 n=1 Tax=Cloeon dipterum TaxID=197152 RepID=A0A8S1DBV7_9INSE|nr:Hypothetical predicted protein [Cloeon dipterum]
MWRVVVVVWAVVLGRLAAAATPYVCYASDQDPYLQFGTRTAYEFSAGRTAGPAGQSDVRGIPGCKPLMVWMVARHGARNPNGAEADRLRQITKLRDEINRNYEERNSKLCPTDAQNLQQWQFTFNSAEEDGISQQGREDMNLMGKRVRTKFEELFSAQEYSEQSYVFKHTNTQRAKISAESFAEGLFPSTQVRFQTNGNNDTLLKSYQNCLAWEGLVDGNPETLKPMEKFLGLPEFNRMVYEVSQRLGFRYNLTQDTILYAYDICRYEKANNIKIVSPWCALFTPDDLKLIEYAEDLRFYHNTGYGNSINSRIGCPLVKDMMYRFRNVANGVEDQPSGVFYFTHLTSVMTLLARLGVANDQPAPSYNNYASQTRRQWKTSALAPFGSNLMAVFFNCTGSSGSVEQKVVFYLQESVLPLPGCDAGLCTWDFVREQFMPLADECNVNRTCAGKDAAAHATLSIAALIISLVATLVSRF